MYLYQQPDWPKFSWDPAAIAAALETACLRKSRRIDRALHLALRAQNGVFLSTLTEEIVRSSEIEGVNFDRQEVRSLLAWRLGIGSDGLPPADRAIEGAVEVMLDATQNFRAALTFERLFNWHASLFPTTRSGKRGIIVGAWRDGPMQIVSGKYRGRRIHYEAPSAEKLDVKMTAFLDWYNSDQEVDPVIKAAIAHLWFVTVHPFEDGNGRIARAIAEMSLSRSDESSQRFYSMSAQICRERRAYYDALESAQKGSLDVTAWLTWFLGCLDRSTSVQVWPDGE